ncbi:putative uncharacterized protein [Parachlamydia acanthamoebae UV-7]|uniref:Uncharacterized protein n=2 Tax=Parachlamydia acanthamoebae TaxID=83552 RepID=F8KW26_PARAV|nr:hypothetical protein pah_c028o017 [Parachlamydia acanthamoebae str. Hall's coccus]KIA76257.1 hypothetical protein DB43_AP00130 [Parachlamydia acanthamoebae]CCB85287.1 putative uncharacterized protein [Parachlamydia acanthamoebae UV-7]
MQKNSMHLFLKKQDSFFKNNESQRNQQFCKNYSEVVLKNL